MDRNIDFTSLSVSHIGYVVDCIEPNVIAFAALYGIKKFDVYDFRPIHAWAYGKEIFDCHFSIAMGVSQSGVNIELIQPISGSHTPQMEFLMRCGGGVHHFSMNIENFDSWKAHFMEISKLNIVFEAAVYDEIRGFRRCIYVQADQSGPVVEFAETRKAQDNGGRIISP